MIVLKRRAALRGKRLRGKRNGRGLTAPGQRAAALFSAESARQTA
jgi:hypothetical protein